MPKIKINKALHALLLDKAEEKGYSSVDEFATHVLEGAVVDADSNTSEEEIRERLQGLGYLA